MHKIATHSKLIFKHACVTHKIRAVASSEKLGGTTKFLKTVREFGDMLPGKHLKYRHS